MGERVAKHGSRLRPPRPLGLNRPGKSGDHIQVSSSEVLLGDSCVIAERLVAAGVDCSLQIWADQVHVFQAAADDPEGRDAIYNVGAFVRSTAPADTELLRRVLASTMMPWLRPAAERSDLMALLKFLGSGRA